MHELALLAWRVELLYKRVCKAARTIDAAALYGTIERFIAAEQHDDGLRQHDADDERV